MKKMILFAIVLLIANCKGGEKAVIVGGWTDQRTDSERVVSAFEFAAREAAKRHVGLAVSRPVRAWTQIVAGTNIRMECPFELAGKKGMARIVVYERLDGTRELTGLDLNPGQ